jgi:hypothetical protein
MYFEPNPVDSKAEKQAFLSNKIKDNGEFEGSDPTGSCPYSILRSLRTISIFWSWLLKIKWPSPG